MNKDLKSIPVALPDITEEEVYAVSQVLRSGWITQGPQTEAFEKELADSLQAKRVYCVSSCTSGLFLVLKAMGVGPGDEVVVPSYSFIATANAVIHAGATPVFADIAPNQLNLDIQSVEGALSERTKAVLLVHQAGMPAHIELFNRLCRKKNISLIEDAACALGSTYEGSPIGSHSQFVVFSFHPRKILTTGEGGAIAYNGKDSKVTSYLDSARRHGMSVSDQMRHKSAELIFEHYDHIGYNFRLTDIQAALGRVQLKRLPQMLEKRRSLVSHYQDRLAGVVGLKLYLDPSYGKTNYQSLLLNVNAEFGSSTLEIMQNLLSKGISTRRGIMASHLEPCYRDAKESLRVPLFNTEKAALQNLVLPLYNSMTERDCDEVCEAIKCLRN